MLLLGWFGWRCKMEEGRGEVSLLVTSIRTSIMNINSFMIPAPTRQPPPPPVSQSHELFLFVRFHLQLCHWQCVYPHQDLCPHHLPAEPGQGDIWPGQEEEDHQSGQGEGLWRQKRQTHLLSWRNFLLNSSRWGN